MTCTVSGALEEIRERVDKENPRYECRINDINHKYGFYWLDRDLVEKTLRKDPGVMIHEEGRTIVSKLIEIVTSQENELGKKWKKWLDGLQN